MKLRSIILSFLSLSIAQIGCTQEHTGYLVFEGENTHYYANNYGRDIAATVARIPLTGGTVVLGEGSYDSPYDLSNPLVRDNIRFVGVGKPTINEIGTIMSGGTIINGGIYINGSGIEVRNLGIDSSDGTDGLVISPQNQLVGNELLKNIVVSDISVMGVDNSSPFHAVLIENFIDSHFENITTYYHASGVVLKGQRSTVSNLRGRGHGNYSFLIKSDDYAPANDITATNIQVSAPASNPALTTHGVRVQAATADLSNVSISNITANDVKQPLFVEGLTGFQASRVTVNGINANDVQWGLNIGENTSEISVSNVQVGGCQYGAVIFNSATNINLSDIKIIDATSRGIGMTGTFVTLRDIYTTNCPIGIEATQGSMHLSNHIHQGTGIPQSIDPSVTLIN